MSNVMHWGLPAGQTWFEFFLSLCVSYVRVCVCVSARVFVLCAPVLLIWRVAVFVLMCRGSANERAYLRAAMQASVRRSARAMSLLLLACVRAHVYVCVCCFLFCPSLRSLACAGDAAQGVPARCGHSAGDAGNRLLPKVTIDAVEFGKCIGGVPVAWMF